MNVVTQFGSSKALGRAGIPTQSMDWLSVLALTLIIALTGCAPAPPTREAATDDIFQLLRGQGFTPNVGLSGTYGPGTVIQTTEVAPGGTRNLPTPIVFLWSSDCFPGQTPRSSPFPLPHSAERQGNSVRVGASVLGRLVPTFKLDHAAVSDYTLTLGNTTIQTFAKGNLSHQFSEKCVQALARALQDGDRIEWFAVIIEAVVVDALSLEMVWREGTSVGARTAQKKAAETQLLRILRTAASAGPPVDASLRVVADNAKASVLQADGPVVVGYRTRPLQPVYEE